MTRKLVSLAAAGFGAFLAAAIVGATSAYAADGISRLIAVTQMKSTNANDEETSSQTPPKENPPPKPRQQKTGSDSRPADGASQSNTPAR